MTGTNKIVLLGTLLAASIIATAQDTEKIVRGHKGDQSFAFRMLPPATFTEIPAPILRDLEKRHCMIPQSYEAKSPENVVHGAFLQQGSNDWAVLCSQDGTLNAARLLEWNRSEAR